MEIQKKYSEKYAIKVKIDSVYINHDYEPYSTERDNNVKEVLKDFGIPLYNFQRPSYFREK